MERFTVPKSSAQTPKPRKPALSNLRLSMREPSIPMIGEPMMEPDAARANHQTGSESCVAEDFLVVERQDSDGDVNTHPEERYQETSGAEVAVLKHVEIDQAARIRPAA